MESQASNHVIKITPIDDIQVIRNPAEYSQGVKWTMFVPSYLSCLNLQNNCHRICMNECIPVGVVRVHNESQKKTTVLVRPWYRILGVRKHTKAEVFSALFWKYFCKHTHFAVAASSFGGDAPVPIMNF